MPSLVAISQATTETNRGGAESAPQALSVLNRPGQIGLNRTLFKILQENLITRKGGGVPCKRLLFGNCSQRNVILGNSCKEARVFFNLVHRMRKFGHFCLNNANSWHF